MTRITSTCRHCTAAFTHNQGQPRIFCASACRAAEWRLHGRRLDTGMDPGICVYCQDPATVHDHVPPRCVPITELPAGHKRGTVPACGECNNTLKDHRAIDLQARRDFIATRYREKYAAILRAPDWAHDPDVSEELNRTMQARVEVRNWIRQRLRCLG